jgi:hypothetical protein
MTHNQQNISPRNAFSRIMLGSVMTAYGTAQIIRDPKSRNGQMLVLLGSMKIAEGATKFCPIKAMGSSMTGSKMLQNMTSGNASQSTLTGVGAAMNGGNASQSTGGTQSMSGGSGQNTVGSNIAQTIGNVAQQMTTGTAAQTIAPQVGQIMNSVASMTGSQNASGNSGPTKSASASNSSGTMQATSSTRNNAPKAGATKTPIDGATNNAKLSNVATSAINTSSKTTDKNNSSSNILQ